MSTNISLNSTQNHHSRLIIGISNNISQKFGSISRYALTVLGIILSLSAFCQPTITSFSPASGAAGTTVTITGTTLPTTVGSCVVYFGGAKAAITSATATSIVCTVPLGAQSGSITVINTSTLLQKVSSGHFVVTYAGGSFAASSYAAAVDFNLGTNTGPSSIELADMDGDGKLDIVAGRNRFASTIAIARNTQTTATPAFAASAAITTGTRTQSFELGDMNGDGKLDILESYTSGGWTYATANTSTSGSLSGAAGVLSYNSGISHFNRGVALIDFDNDGKRDPAVLVESGPSFANSTYSIVRNTSTAAPLTFAPILSTSAKIFSLAGEKMWECGAADFDNDGRMDIATYETLNSTGQLIVKRNDATTGLDGTNEVKININTTSPVSGKMRIADIDGDGKQDILIQTNAGGGDIRIYRNTSTGSTLSFTTPAGAGFGTGVNVKTSFVLADVTGDGKLDLVIASNTVGAGLYVLPNTSTSGSISFGTVVSFAGPAAADVAVGDVNGDGRPDIVTISNATDNASVYINQNVSAAPTITSFTPTTGPVGTSVVITGTNFTGATEVSFGFTLAASYTVNSATQITATIAPGTGTGQVRVTASGNVAVSGGNFTPTGQPTITSFTPASGPVGTTVIVTGTNFTGVTAVSFDNTPAASYTVNSATQITAVVAAGTASGSRVRVTASGYVVNSGATFTVTAAAIPTITGIVGPLSGATNWIVTGGMLTINGTNFTGATAVTIGTSSTPVTSFTVVSATQITCRVAGATTTGSGPVRVTVGTTATSTNYTIISGLPVINSFSPATGNAGTTVVINGTNLYIDNGSPNPTVTIGANNTPATFVGYTGNDLTVSVGAGTNTGPIRITTTYGTVTSTTNFTVASAAPTITSFTPSSGPVGTSVIITGTNFTGATNVFVGAGVTNSTFTLNSATQITATIPAGATTGPISVVIPGFMATSPTNFTVVAAPSITSIDFLTGPIGSFVTVTGSNLLGATAFMANGVAMAVSNNTATSVRLQVPTGGLSGPIQLSANGSTVITQFFTVTTAANVLQHIPGQTLTLTSAVTAATYQWQVNTGSGFVNISNNANYSGATTYRLVVNSMPTSWTGYRYRVVAGGVNSTEQTLRFVHTSLGGNWNAAVSWHLGQIPDQYGDVFLKPSSPVLNVNVNASCRSLTANASNLVTVKTGVVLTIHK